jgi:hypothetical protein
MVTLRSTGYARIIICIVDDQLIRWIRLVLKIVLRWWRLILVLVSVSIATVVVAIVPWSLVASATLVKVTATALRWWSLIMLGIQI